MDIPVNYLAVFTAALAAFVFGFLVHGPIFGKVWLGLMKVSHKDMEKGKKDMEKKMPLYMLVAFVQQLVTAFVLEHFVHEWGVFGVPEAFILAFLVWLGFVAMKLLDGVLWEKRSIALYAFNVAYHLGSLVIMSVILALWR